MKKTWDVAQYKGTELNPSTAKEKDVGNFTPQMGYCPGLNDYGVKNPFICYSYSQYSDMETEAQRDKATLPKVPQLGNTEPEFNTKSVWAQISLSLGHTAYC